jgi:DNA N-6-adenine-methyltransferase (Dam)
VDIRTQQDPSLPTKESRRKAEAIHALGLAETIAKRIKDASKLEKALLEKLDAQREFAIEYQRKFPHGGDRTKQEDTSVHLRDDWCKAHGFHERTVRRWLILVEEQAFIDRKNAIMKRCWALAELWQAANFSSESNEWYTPARYIEAVRECLGGVDLDPASNKTANAVVQAATYFTKKDNGLKKDWRGTFFLNPPYGLDENKNSLAGEFCKKAIYEYQIGNATAGIILVNSLHSQSWQAPLYRFPVCFVDHRIKFMSDDGRQNENPTFQNIFIYLGPNVGGFALTFARFGYVMQRLDVR